MRPSLLLSLFAVVTFAQDGPLAVTPFDQLADFIKPYAQSLLNINSSTAELDSGISAFQGTAQVFSLLADSQNLLKTIKNETTTDEALPPINGDDINNSIDLATYVVNLGYFVNLTIFDLVNKKDDFEQACVGPVVLDQIQQQSSAADIYQSLVIGKLPDSLQDIGTTLASTIPVALASGVAAFADQTTVPASCSATTTTTTSEATSTSSTTTGPTSSSTTETTTGMTSQTTDSSTYATGTGASYSSGGSVYSSSSTTTTTTNKDATSTYGVTTSVSYSTGGGAYSTTTEGAISTYASEGSSGSSYSEDGCDNDSTETYTSGTYSSAARSGYGWQAQSSFGPGNGGSSAYTTGAPYSSASEWSPVIASSGKPIGPTSGVAPTDSTSRSEGSPISYASAPTTGVSPAHPISPSYAASTPAGTTTEAPAFTTAKVGTYTGAAAVNSVHHLTTIVVLASIAIIFI